MIDAVRDMRVSGQGRASKRVSECKQKVVVYERRKSADSCCANFKSVVTNSSVDKGSLPNFLNRSPLPHIRRLHTECTPSEMAGNIDIQTRISN